MEYTEEQKEQFKQEFAVKRRRQLMLSAPLVIVVVLFMLADNRRGAPLLVLPPAVMWAGLGLILFGLVFSFKNWRCPACGKYLGRSFGPRHCPKCGVALR